MVVDFVSIMAAQALPSLKDMTVHEDLKNRKKNTSFGSSNNMKSDVLYLEKLSKIIVNEFSTAKKKITLYRNNVFPRY